MPRAGIRYRYKGLLWFISLLIPAMMRRFVTTTDPSMSLFTKNTTPNFVALALIIASFWLPEPARAIILNVGLFALSGALTNWLAVHMLFQKVPGLYGSGVIPVHFEEFKTGILSLVTKHLFKRENVEAALSAQPIDDGSAENTGSSETTGAAVDLSAAVDALDMDIAFDQLANVIMESSFGAMLGMVGGATALEPMRGPFTKKMRSFLNDTTQSPAFQRALADQISSIAGSDEFMSKIHQIVQQRLDELTPEMVRDIVQEMIRKHLGWLVVWGGVIGGLMGLIATAVQIST